MIKFFQKLKAKKGFTLVELIVVIAIIGVLAAILIPTMLGYVTSSRVQSSNSTAAELKNMVNNFITDMDTKGFTFDRANEHTCVIGFEGDEVDVTFSSDAFKLPSNTSTTQTDIEDELARRITNDFGFTKETALVHILNGKPVGCAYSADGIAFAAGDTTFTLDAFQDAKNFDKWGDTDGVCGSDCGDFSGTIVGTAPQLMMPIGSAEAAGE